ncbi:MAG: GNAT family N-acetyltransferase [Parachlamydiales bacterium]|nr:GNAT family N-acetyltransferase [Candidatus Acheromyda pituitae]
MIQEHLVQQARSVEQIQSCYNVMRQLRPHLEEKLFVERVKRQQIQGYQLAYLEIDGEVRACAGFRILEFLAWGKVLYIDDLVTDSAMRKNGLASVLLKWVLEQGKAMQCDQVHLDSGPQRHDAHRLYLNHGFTIIGYHFAKEGEAVGKLLCPEKSKENG